MPKCNRRSQLGKNLGFYDEHSSLVLNVLDLTTGYISPQYHFLFDYLFWKVCETG